MTNSNFNMGGCSANLGYGPTTPISAKTDGTTIVLSVFSKTKPSAFLCGGSLTKKP